MDKICLNHIQYSGEIRGCNVSEDLRDFTYEFDFGKTYLLDAPLGEGAWTLSWIIGGAIQPNVGEIHLVGSAIGWPQTRQDSWLVKYDEIKKFGVIHQSIKAQIRSGIRKTKNDHSISEEQILEAFYLTPERYNRRLAQLSSEAWRASCAIGFAHGKSIFCFPHMDYLRPGFIDEYRSLWFEAMLQFLKSQGGLVIFPSQSSESTTGLFDRIVRLPSVSIR